MFTLQFIQTLCFAITVAVMAFVYKEFLLPGVLHFWAKVGDRYERAWFYKPVWGCFRCIAGQMALWLYLVTHLFRPHAAANGPRCHYFTLYDYVPAVGPYSFIGHIFAICAAILITDIFVKFYNKL